MCQTTIKFVFSLIVSFVFSSSLLAQLVWKPAGNNVLMSNAENWEGGVAPTEGDDLVIINASASSVTWDITCAVGEVYVDKATLTVNAAISAEKFVVSNSTVNLNLALESQGDVVFGGSGTVKMKTSPITAGGDVVIGGSITVTHIETRTAANSKVKIVAAGNMTIESSAKINVDNKFGISNWQDGSFYGYQGLNIGKPGGGWHGGFALGISSIMSPYGNIYDPTDYGKRCIAFNSTLSYAGGIVILEAGGELVLNGDISSCGQSNKASASAGGSVNITAGAIEGGGSITASGSKSTSGSHSSGGRIAVKLTQEGSTFDEFTGNIYAYGGNDSKGIAGSGTVYLKTGSQSLSEGTLIVEGTSSNAADTLLGGEVTGLEFGTVIVRNASLRLAENAHLKISGDFINEGKFTAMPGSIIEFTGTGASKITGDNVFKTVVCATPGKTLQIADGSAQSVEELLYLAGGEGNPVALAGENGGTYSLSLAAGAGMSLINLSLSGCDASQGKALEAANSTAGDCENITLLTLPAGNTVTWTGNSSGSFENAENWNPRKVPSASDSVVIPSGSANFPVIRFSTTAASLNIGENASLYIADGATLTVSGNVTGGGTLQGAAANLVLGSATSSFTLGEMFLDKIDASAVSSATVSGKIICKKFLCENASGAAISFARDSSLTVMELVLKGDGQNPNISFGSDFSWKLDAMTAELEGVQEITGCDMSKGGAYLGFGEDPRTIYESGIELSDETDLYVVGTSVTFPAAGEAVGSLTVGEGATVTVNGQFSVTRSVVIQNGGKIVWNQPGEIGGSLIVEEGGVLTHSQSAGNGAGSPEQNKIDLDIGGSVYVAQGGKIDAVGKGFFRNVNYKNGGGLGYTHAYTGLAHGGRGIASAKLPYGSIFAPTNLGSTATLDNNVYNNTTPSKADFGGGAIKLAVAGLLVNDGDIDASASNWHPNLQNYCCSGGSVFLEASSFAGKGNIFANASNSKDGNYTAGGRIAIICKSPAMNGFKGKILAAGSQAKGESNFGYGYHRYGSAGTIYMQYGKTLGNGELIIDADRATRKDHSQILTDLTPTVSCDPNDKKALKYTKVTVRNGGRLYVTEDTTILDLVLEGEHAYLKVAAGATLKIRQFEHALGEKASQVAFETNAETGATGSIEWKTKGVKLMLR